MHAVLQLNASSGKGKVLGYTFGYRHQFGLFTFDFATTDNRSLGWLQHYG